MKRLLSIFLLLAMLLGLVGCGNTAESETQATTTVAPTTEPVATVSQAAMDALDGKRVLLIGNSYTFWGKAVINKDNSILRQDQRSNDHGLFYQLCSANGMEVSVTNWAFGAHNFTDIMSNNCLCESSGCYGADHMSYLTDAAFDYVAMQLFFETEYTGDLVSHLKPTMDFFRQANPDVKFLLVVPHMTYVRQFQWRDDIPALAAEGVTICNWGAMLDDVVNKRVEVPGATQQYFQNTFVISRNADDGHHQNILAGYLTALTIYCAITGDSAVGQPYDFCDDSSKGFGVEEFYQQNYTYDTHTNFIDVYRSKSDMKGLQQLVDTYLAKYNEGAN